MRLLFFYMFLALSETALAAGDATEIFNAWNIKITLEGGMLGHEIDYEENPNISLPDYLREDRKNYKQTERFKILQKDEMTDNPLFHGAMYIDLALEAGKGGIGILSEIIAEHRGISYGVYDMDNTAVFMKFNIGVDTTFKVKNETLEFGISAGNYDNQTLHEGLTIYNIDTQGMYAYLKWRNLKLWHSQIGDFCNGIGLNINDGIDYALSLEDIDILDLLSVNLQAGYYDYPTKLEQGIDISNSGVNLSIALTRKESLRLYSQLGIRDVGDNSYSGIKRCGHLAGCRYRYRGGRFDVSLKAERRFYGRYFNYGYKNLGSGFLFRSNKTATNLYKNTIGEYIYPLSLYLRPFSQWAVYTEYQGRDVQSLIFQAEARYNLPAGFFADSFLDFNYIDVSNEPSFLYPFYEIAIGWEPVKGTFAKAGWTNRGMNLDKHYPTLYLLESGLLMLEVGTRMEF